MSHHRLRLINWIKDRYGSIHFHFMDYILITYLAVIGLLIIPFHQDVPRWGVYPFAHLIVIIGFLEFMRVYTRTDNKVMRFIRHFYPILFSALGWMELNNLITMIFPYWFNDWLVRIDLWLFGVHPTVWIERIFQPWLTEVMNFFYTFLWFFIPVTAIPLYFSGRRQETLDFMLYAMLTFSLSFFLFLIFPGEGAWIILKDLHTVEPVGGPLLKLNQLIQSGGSIRGGAFPSVHVSEAVAMALAAIRYRKRTGYFLLFAALGVACSTVYCRYHHVTDAIGGVVFGVILFLMGNKILAWWHGKRQPAAENTD